MKNPKLAITGTTLYLLIFTISTQISSLHAFVFILFAFSPFLLIWMVYTVLKFGSYPGRELSEDEEWGYQDIGREELNKKL